MSSHFIKHHGATFYILQVGDILVNECDSVTHLSV